MHNVWIRTGNSYYMGETSDQMEKLDPGVYRWGVDVRDTPFLSKTADAFSFNHKIYGMEKEFIARVKKTYDATEGNMGVLLNGTKGTGKTVTAKQIANMLNLPVILLTDKHDKIVPYLNDIQEDVVVFIDEYEKSYSNYDNTLLTILDGVLTTKHRKFFILTTNELNINTYLLQRPGRIYYIKTFTDLSLETINEVIDDLLKYPELKESCIKFISELSIITIDLIKAILQEVNIHNEEPAKFKDIFNVSSSNDISYSLAKIDENGAEKPFMDFVTLQLPPDKLSEGSYFRVNGENFGMIQAILPNRDFVVYKTIYDDDTDEITGQEKTIFRIKLPVSTIHHSFLGSKVF